jgi:hypothetical protein
MPSNHLEDLGQTKSQESYPWDLAGGSVSAAPGYGEQRYWPLNRLLRPSSKSPAAVQVARIIPGIPWTAHLFGS